MFASVSGGEVTEIHRLRRLSFALDLSTGPGACSRCSTTPTVDHAELADRATSAVAGRGGWPGRARGGSRAPPAVALARPTDHQTPDDPPRARRHHPSRVVA